MTSTTVDALKALYISLGGLSTDVANITTIPDMILAIANFDFSAVESITKDAQGNVCISAPSEKKLIIQAETGSEIDIDSAGEINISADTGISIKSESNSDIEMLSDGNISISSPEGNIEIEADTETEGSYGALHLTGTAGVSIDSNEADTTLACGEFDITASAAKLNNKAIATEE